MESIWHLTLLQRYAHCRTAYLRRTNKRNVCIHHAWEYYVLNFQRHQLEIRSKLLSIPSIEMKFNWKNIKVIQYDHTGLVWSTCSLSSNLLGFWNVRFVPIWKLVFLLIAFQLLWFGLAGCVCLSGDRDVRRAGRVPRTVPHSALYPAKHSAGVNNDDAQCSDAVRVRQLQYNYTAGWARYAHTGQ